VVQFESRIGVVEAKLEEHSKMILGLREAVVALGERVGSLERRMDQLEGRMEHRFDIQDARMSSQFHWLVGILLSGLIAMVGVLGGLVAVMLSK
jgi:hypothetical protein